jgi:hypothetical protein
MPKAPYDRHTTGMIVIETFLTGATITSVYTNMPLRKGYAYINNDKEWFVATKNSEIWQNGYLADIKVHAKFQGNWVGERFQSAGPHYSYRKCNSCQCDPCKCYESKLAEITGRWEALETPSAWNVRKKRLEEKTKVVIDSSTTMFKSDFGGQDKPAYILKGHTMYRWNGSRWQSLLDPAYSVSEASIHDLQEAGYSFPAQAEVDKYKQEHGKLPHPKLAKLHLEQAMESVELTLRRLEALPLWREEDLVPSIIKW